MTPETTAILLRAADRVEFNGWCQTIFARDGFGCATFSKDRSAVAWSAIGAIHIESIEDKTCASIDAIIACEELLAKFWEHGSLPAYNDAPNRIAPEVAHLLRAAALEGLWA